MRRKVMVGTFIRRLTEEEECEFQSKAERRRTEMIQEERRLNELETRLRKVIDAKLLAEGNEHKCVYFPLEDNDGSEYVVGETYEEAGLKAVERFGENRICRFFQVGDPDSPFVLGMLPGRRS